MKAIDQLICFAQERVSLKSQAIDLSEKTLQVTPVQGLWECDSQNNSSRFNLSATAMGGTALESKI